MKRHGKQKGFVAENSEINKILIEKNKLNTIFRVFFVVQTNFNPIHDACKSVELSMSPLTTLFNKHKRYPGQVERIL